MANHGRPLPRAGSRGMANNCSQAARTCATGRLVRQSLTLLSSQPARPQGRQGWFSEATTRWRPPPSLSQGPHSRSPDGPKMPTVGVPIAAAMCIGAESTPTNSRARAARAASSLSDSWPEKSRVDADSLCVPGTSLARREAESRVYRDRGQATATRAACTAAISAISLASGAEVSTMGRPFAASASHSAATRSAGQHLKAQRDAG